MKLRKILIILSCIFSFLVVGTLTSCITINTNISEEETYLMEKILARRVGHAIGKEYPGEAIYLRESVEKAQKALAGDITTTDAEGVLTTFVQELMQDSFKIDPLLAQDLTDICNVFVSIELPEGAIGEEPPMLTEEQRTHLLVVLGGIEDGLAIAEAELLIKQ